MSNPYENQLSSIQEDYLTIAESCGLKQVDFDNDQPVFIGTLESFRKFEELGVPNAFYLPDPTEHRSDEGFICE